jgi:hypothetical protein
MNDEDTRRVPKLARSLKRAKRLAAICLCFLAADWLVVGVISKASRPRGYSHPKWFDSVLIGAFAVGIWGLLLLGVAIAWALVAQTRLRTLLQAAQGMLCPRCGYDLHGVTSGLCPECGREYDSAGVSREWRDEYATALPPWPANPPQNDDPPSH